MLRFPVSSSQCELIDRPIICCYHIPTWYVDPVSTPNDRSTNETDRQTQDKQPRGPQTQEPGHLATTLKSESPKPPYGDNISNPNEEERSRSIGDLCGGNRKVTSRDNGVGDSHCGK